MVPFADGGATGAHYLDTVPSVYLVLVHLVVVCRVLGAFVLVETVPLLLILHYSTILKANLSRLEHQIISHPILC